MFGDLAGSVRSRLADGVRTTLGATDDEPPDVGPEFHGPPGDPGWFGPESPAWTVHADLSMLIGGLRALLVQLFHPLAMAGVADHSDFRADPAGRLDRTARFVAATTYGNSPAAEQAVAMVRAVHRTVNGTTDDGRRYDANDPHLLLWVHAAEVDSFLRAYQRFGRSSLDERQADRYVSDMARVASALGSDVPPRSVDGLRAWLRGMRPQMEIGDHARRTTRFLLNPPGLPLAARGAYAVVAAAAVGLLPTWARLELRLPPLPLVDRLAVAPAARLLVGTVGWAMGSSPYVAAARRRVGLEPTGEVTSGADPPAA
jgi:uncharacterized protein (DUF2236 family)